MQPSDLAPATKADLRAYATKDDLQIALKGYATKTDLQEMARTITAEIREFLRPTQILLARHDGEMKGIRDELKAIRAEMVTRDEFHSRMDGFAGLLLDSRQRWAVHADTLNKHDERLKKLEPRDS